MRIARPRTLPLVAALALIAAAAIGCAPTDPPASDTSTDRRAVDIGDVTLGVDVHGTGRPLLLVHGAGEDADMLAVQARSLAAAGYRVIAYDRRGTGRSGRRNWPGDGADQHADDAAGLLRALGIDRATVLGVSSGGIVALALAARHPERVGHVVAWEPPAAGVVAGGPEAAAQLMRPVEDHLAAHPGDWPGAQAILLAAITGAPVDDADPALAATRANAEPMVRDDPTITLRRFSAEDMEGRRVTLAIGPHANPLIRAGVQRLAALAGTRPVRIDAEHEVYLSDGAPLTRLVADGAPPDPPQSAVAARRG